jgi:hypothetical protein
VTTTERTLHQAIGAGGVIVVLFLAFFAWAMIGGKVVLTKPADGQGTAPTMIVFP